MRQALLSPVVSLVHGRPATTSLAITEHFGKRHDDVLKSVRRLCVDLPEEIRARNFAETFRTVAGPNNSKREELYFTVFFDGFILLVMGYTGKQALQIKLGYIEAFNAMREQLEKRAAPTPLPEPATCQISKSVKLTLSTAADRAPLRSIVNAWARVSGLPHDALWPQVRAAFNLGNIKELPAEWVPDAIAWVQDRINSGQPNRLVLPEAIPNPPALQPSVHFDEDGILALAEDIRAAQQAHRRAFASLYGRFLALSTPVFMAMEQVIYKRPPEQPTKGTALFAQMDALYTERLMAALTGLGEVSDERNPAMMLLEYARALSV